LSIKFILYKDLLIDLDGVLIEKNVVFFLKKGIRK